MCAVLALVNLFSLLSTLKTRNHELPIYLFIYSRAKPWDLELDLKSMVAVATFQIITVNHCRVDVIYAGMFLPCRTCLLETNYDI